MTQRGATNGLEYGERCCRTPATSWHASLWRAWTQALSTGSCGLSRWSWHTVSPGPVVDRRGLPVLLTGRYQGAAVPLILLSTHLSSRTAVVNTVQHRSWSPSREQAHLPAEQPPPREDPRLPAAYAYARR